MSKFVWIWAILGWINICLGTYIYVDVNGPNDPGTGRYEDPFRRIQDAINYAKNGDIIEIRPGMYTGVGNYNLDPSGLAITICGTDPNDTDVVAGTIIDPNQWGRGFYFHNSEDANCIISGLTIRNALAGESGAGVYCDNSSPTISNCMIVNNLAGENGGGVYCYNSESVFKNCVIGNNYAAADSGGGLKCDLGSPQLKNCIISNNISTDYGGGVDCYLADLNLVNCNIINNIAGSKGGAIYAVNSNVIIRNSIIWFNSAAWGEQFALYQGAAAISYCDIQGGNSMVYDPCGILIWGDENIEEDPCFAYFDVGDDPCLWDFHLQSIYGRWDESSSSWVTDSHTSPCLDGGDSASPWDNEPWPNGKCINMGAYGGTVEASKNGNIADFDVSGSVNLNDLVELASKWLNMDFCFMDLDLSGSVDLDDFTIFADNWLWQKE